MCYLDKNNYQKGDKSLVTSWEVRPAREGECQQGRRPGMAQLQHCSGKD